MTNEQMTTPAGVAMWAYLHKPDTKWSTEGHYTITLRLPKDDGASLRQQLQTKFDEHITLLTSQMGKEPKTNALPIKDVTDDQGNDLIEIRFKLKPSFKSRSGEVIEQRPQVFDAKLQPMDASTLGNGSRVKVSFKANEYASPIGAGVSFRLVAVQVLDLVQRRDDGEFTGFSVEEGFETEASVAPAPTKSEEKTQSTDDGSAF